MSDRTIRLNELMQRELSDILRQRYQSEAVALTVTEVRVAPDLRDARVFVAVVGSPEVAEQKLRWLRRQARAIREEMSKRIVLKFLPKFEYVLDESTVKSLNVLRLLDQLPAAPPEPEEEE
jgi:ribosome-binding factor A